MLSYNFNNFTFRVKNFLKLAIKYLLMLLPNFILKNSFFFNKKFYYKKKGFNNWENFFFSGEQNFVKKNSKKKFDYALDIGANIGDFSKMLIREFDRNCKIYALEPQEGCLKYLKKLKFKYNNFNYFNYAISNNNGFSHIYFETKNSQVASLLKSEKLKTSWSKNDKIYSNLVKTINFDTLYKKIGIKKNHNLFIKIDTEGLEVELLKNFFNKKLAFSEILFELDQLNALKICKFLEELNKKVNFILYILLPFNYGIKRISISYLKKELKYCNLLIRNNS